MHLPVPGACAARVADDQAGPALCSRSAAERPVADQALDEAEDPRELLDCSYTQQMELLGKVRHDVADVATRRERVELRTHQLQQSADNLQTQAQQALAAGREDLAREALTRRTAVTSQFTDLKLSRHRCRRKRTNSSSPHNACGARWTRSADEAAFHAVLNTLLDAVRRLGTPLPDRTPSAALGRGNSVVADDLFTHSSAALMATAEETDVSRLVWLSSFGVGHTFAWASGPQKVIYRTLLRSIYANKEIADDGIRSSGLDRTVVYPTRLTHGPAKGAYRAGDRLPMKGNPTVSRADVAAFTYQAAHGSEWIHRSAVICD